MARDGGAAGESAGRTAVTRRELAVARVLDPARERAESKVQAFLDAALDLMNGDSGQEFTVQEVIERSGQSLRSFYQHFDGKYELLLALFEDSVRSAAAALHEAVAEETTPLAKLHRFAVDYYDQCQPSPKRQNSSGGFAPTFATFAQQLLTDHPQEASRAFVPLTEMLEGLLIAAAADGAIRTGMDYNRVAGVILQAIMFNVFAATISGPSVRASSGGHAEELWDLLVRGLVTPAR
ncbi:MAG TPA: TetR/AcrR family transcriptional regulator [Mycobacteriales bacterium]|nr:TetR/AcrR family transcriptional regulator [Mycobacteriales bacterium]